MSGSIASLGTILKTCNRDHPRKQEALQAQDPIACVFMIKRLLGTA